MGNYVILCKWLNSLPSSSDLNKKFYSKKPRKSCRQLVLQHLAQNRTQPVLTWAWHSSHLTLSNVHWHPHLVMSLKRNRAWWSWLTLNTWSMSWKKDSSRSDNVSYCVLPTTHNTNQHNLTLSLHKSLIFKFYEY